LPGAFGVTTVRRPGGRDDGGRRAPDPLEPLSVTSGELAQVYGFTDLDGSRPDVWRYHDEEGDDDPGTNLADYR
jgi:hypothetical protein